MKWPFQVQGWKEMKIPPRVREIQNMAFFFYSTKFTATEQKLITGLCRTDGQSSMDRLGFAWIEKIIKDPNSTVESTCLFTFLKRHDIRILKIVRQGYCGETKVA